jgi:hypothetical protein
MLSKVRRAEIEEYLALGHDKWQWRDLPFEVEAGWATTRELLEEIDRLNTVMNDHWERCPSHRHDND